MTPFFSPTYIISILIAISIHEWAHAYTAHRLGDDTARYAGRMTINPIAHLDLMGAMFFLFVGFGWAKPVPVDPRALRHPKRDTAIVSLAGPFSNLVLAVVAFVGILLLVPEHMTLSLWGLLELSSRGDVLRALLLQILGSSLFVNLALMAFNLLPIAPLDGSKIVGAFIPWQYEREYEQFLHYGPVILLFLIIFESFLPIPLISSWVHGIMDFVLSAMGFVVGAV